MSHSVVMLSNVSFRYEDVPILENVDLDVPEGDFLGIIGPNGSGKTTLLKIILGLLVPVEGDLQVFGQPPHLARRSIGYIPQLPDFDRDFPISVREVVLMGRLSSSSRLGGYRKEDHEAAEVAMKDVEIHDLRHRRLGTLSGGQRQRVLIARALASNPRLLILDEPTASVDTRAEKDIYELLRKLNQRTTIILVSHDLAFVSTYVKRVACLNRRLICHPTARISAELIEQLYERPMHLVEHHRTAGWGSKS